MIRNKYITITANAPTLQEALDQTTNIIRHVPEDVKDRLLSAFIIILTSLHNQGETSVSIHQLKGMYEAIGLHIILED